MKVLQCERRRAPLLRVLWAWFHDVDADTREKSGINALLGMAGALLVFGEGIIAVPPPILRSYGFTLPAWVFAAGLLLAGCLKFRGRILRSRDIGTFQLRRLGSAIACGTLAFMVGPLYDRTGPSLGVVFAVLFLIQEISLWLKMGELTRAANAASAALKGEGFQGAA